MWALRVAAITDPPTVETIECARPAPAPGEVLARLTAASLNYRDLELARRGAGPNAPMPYTPFSDGCGIVEEVGAGVTAVKAGERVCSIFFPNWIAGEVGHASRSIALGMPGAPGVGQEYFVLPERAVIRPPDSLTDEQAATLPCAGVTAWRAVMEVARLQPGMSVLLQGTGGVSIFALQFARAAGLRTIITSSSDDKLARARKLGADHTINYRTTPDWASEARALTQKRGVDLVVEVGGAGTLTQSLKAVRTGGAIAVIGILSGRKQEVDVTALFSTNLTVQGISVGSWEMFAAMNRAIAHHGIKPLIDSSFRFDQATEALASLAAANHIGKVVLSAR